jgi:hypothetical protein
MHAFVFYFFLAKPSLEPSLAAGCSNNDDCPDYSACRNTKCINPCAEDQPCAPLATCKVYNHKVLCTCPDGYVGSPETSCRPRKYPYSNTTRFFSQKINRAEIVIVVWVLPFSKDLISLHFQDWACLFVCAPNDIFLILRNTLHNMEPC